LNECAGAYTRTIVAMALGPQDGTVDARFIKKAAKEALANR
jgi:hypothetical protein